MFNLLRYCRCVKNLSYLTVHRHHSLFPLLMMHQEFLKEQIWITQKTPKRHRHMFL